ncbi:hypothetical protein Tco_0448450 [Tanacetum coccineum]
MLKKHKVMDVYVEIVEKNEESESGSDSASESDNDFEDEEHVVQEVEVNMGYFNFQVEDASTGTDGNMIPVAPKVNLTEDNIEVLDFDSLESDLEDVPENDRRDVAKDLIRTHAVESRRNLHFLRNDPIRIRVVCNGVVPCKNLVTYKVPGPNVDNAVKGKIVNEDAEEDKITYLIIMNPSMPIKEIQEQMQKKFHVAISKDKAFRVKAKAAVSLRGDVKIQYALLRDYVMELKRCNPDTTVKIDVYGEEDPESPTRLFRRIYVCLGALKKGFREGGRELLGLDGAFMRGQYPRQMLTAVGVDANNGIYPVAYGIVESESVLWIGMALINTRKWEISGIPCKHAIAAIHDMADNGNDVGIPEDWVHDSYKLATWKAVYSHKVNPVNGRELWSKFDCPTTLLPPKIHPQIGRPPKKRKKSKGEIVMVKGNKLTRQGKTVTYSLCHAARHNKRSCDRRQPSQGGTSNAAGVGTQPSEGGTSNAAGVGPQASQGGTSNAAGVGTQASQGGTSNAAGTKRKSKGSTGTSNAAGTQASQASKGGTSNASTGSPLKRTKKSAKIIDLSSSIEAQIDGSEPGNEGSSMPHLPPFGSVGRPRPEVPADIAKRFKEGDITRELVKWYGYVDILEYFEDDAYWDSYSPTTDEKEVTLGKYIPNGKHAAARPIIKSEAFQTGVVLGVANPKTWAAIDEKLRKRPSKH